ncbi:spore germination protein [Clostridia bacterium]|nr:spore germination protein [Clostridia bacterium]
MTGTDIAKSVHDAGGEPPAPKPKPKKSIFELSKVMETEKISPQLEMNITNMRTMMGSSSDFIVTKGALCGIPVSIMSCEAMVSGDTVAQMVFSTLNTWVSTLKTDADITPDILRYKLTNDLLFSLDKTQVVTLGDAAKYIMSGFIVIFIDGADTGVATGAQGFKSRAVEKASTQQNLRGSCEGFVEVMRTNVSLIRRRCKSPSLVFKYMTLGDISNTEIALTYMTDKADPALITALEDKIKSIPLGIVLEGGFIQPFLEEGSGAVFSEVGTTDRPDVLVGKLSEGRVGLIVDGTPYVMYLPHLFVENFQTMDDYTEAPIYVSMMRWMKYFAFFFTVMLPGFFLALTNFNPELIQNKLLTNMVSAVQSTPYPLLLECLLIYVVYEIMREAGLRLPQAVGNTVSIVGGLVIGDIVVTAGLVGAPMVLIVGLTAITSYVVPNLYDAVAVLRFAFILAGGLLGLYGIALMGVATMIAVCSMREFGVSYTAPIMPFSAKAMRFVCGLCGRGYVV